MPDPTAIPLRPTTSNDLAAAVAKVSHEHSQVRLVGANSLPLAQFGSERPIQEISTLRMNKVIEHAVGDMTVCVQAGISLEGLQKHLAWQNQWLPVDPPAVSPRTPGARTLGGLIATNSLGPLRDGCGDWRLMILGMKWINANGTVIAGGGRTMKNVAGYSSPRMMIGSCGTLGAIAEVTLRTFARPAEERCLILFCESPAEAERLLAEIALSPTTPAYVQAVGARTFAKNPLGLPSPQEASAQGTEGGTGGIVVIVGFLGRVEVCAAQLEVIRDLPAARGLESIAQTMAQAGRLRLWMTSEPAIGQPANGERTREELADGDLVGLRLHVRPSRVAEMVAAIEATSRETWVVSEAGTGVIRAVGGNAATVRIAAESEAAIVTQGRMGLPGAASEGAQRLKGALDPENRWGSLPPIAPRGQLQVAVRDK